MEVIDEDGVMTKDLALAIHGKGMKREHWVVTDVYMDAVKVRFFRILFDWVVVGRGMEGREQGR